MSIISGMCYWCEKNPPISPERLGCTACNNKHILDYSYSLLGEYIY